jgi:hypothetical protein
MFSSDDGIVIGSYSGGTIAIGNVIAKHISATELEMVYQSVTIAGDVQAGKACAIFKPDQEKKMHVYLDWQWLTGDQSKGSSAWESV